jgi:nucleoside phosphorylase
MCPSSRENSTVAIICALAFEAEAVEAHFDEIYDRLGRHYGKNKGDRNCYLNGRIGKHEVVLCYMPEMGKGSAAMVASDLRHSYSNIEIALLVGICGGVPKLPSGQPIFLGDAIIGDSILAYDFGKQYPDAFRRKPNSKEILGGSSHELKTLLTGLSVGQARRDFQHQMAEYRQRVQQAHSRWHRPESDDVLFDSQYPHKHHTRPVSTYCVCFSGDTSDQICDDATRNDCASLGCEEGQIRRRRQQMELSNAAVHIGKAASADRVMKSASHRDKLAEAEEVIAFEMEGAGVCDNFPCIIIKGVSDYADSHKDSKWQSYAAVNAAAAAAAKTLLKYLNPVAPKGR